MSDFDVYDSDMPQRRLTFQDDERLLGGAVPEHDELARLAAILVSLHRTGRTAPPAEVVATFSARAGRIASAGREMSFDNVAPMQRHRHFFRKPLVGALGGAALVLGMTGVAVADDAVPGDALYGLDRAMESIGLGASGPPERIAEARVLFRRGQITAAIAHAAEALPVTTPEGGNPQQSLTAEEAEAVDALRGAVERVQVQHVDAEDPVVRDAVAGLLGEIAAMLDSNSLQPGEFGARISELARAIGRSGGDVSENAEPPDATPEGAPSGPDSPGGPPDDIPAGPPSGVPAGPPIDVPGNGLGIP